MKDRSLSPAKLLQVGNFFLSVFDRIAHGEDLSSMISSSKRLNLLPTLCTAALALNTRASTPNHLQL